MKFQRPIFFFVLLLLVLIISSALPVIQLPASDTPTISLLYASAGIMPQLVNTSQVDGFIVWEPVVSTAVLGGIGKRIATQSSLPPPDTWNKAACCVLVMRNQVIADYPEIASLIAAVTSAGMEQITQDPQKAQKITADWVFGSNSIRSAGLSLLPVDVEKEAFTNLYFVDTAQIPRIGSIQDNQLSGIPSGAPSLVNTTIAMRGRELLAGKIPQISTTIPTISIGYLPSSDHNAPFYVTIMESRSICDKYGFCIVPKDGDGGRPTECSLIVGNQTVAIINLLPGQVGGGIMTGMGQDAVDVAYVGAVPAIYQITHGNQASIIQSVNTEGTGLVVDETAPCHDWDSFIVWVKNRSKENRPVILAVPQSSIQEEMIRGALAAEHITISLYGLPFR